jgi:ribosomal 50S subunit-recycling heat shock protein
MRLDKFLKVSRIIKRRTIANEACDAGRIEVNGKVARASYNVKVGDKITINLSQNSRSYEVLEISEHALKEDAAKMYKAL